MSSLFAAALMHSDNRLFKSINVPNVYTACIKTLYNYFNCLQQKEYEFIVLYTSNNEHHNY